MRRASFASLQSYTDRVSSKRTASDIWSFRIISFWIRLATFGKQLSMPTRLKLAMIYSGTQALYYLLFSCNFQPKSNDDSSWESITYQLKRLGSIGLLVVPCTKLRTDLVASFLRGQVCIKKLATCLRTFIDRPYCMSCLCMNFHILGIKA